jgi:hypothetical protein
MMVAVNQYFDVQCENYRKSPDDRKLIYSIPDANMMGAIEMLWRYGARNCPIWTMILLTWWDSTVLANSIDRTEAESALTPLVFALELYRKEHENRYPPDLATLCDGYIEKVPRDPFSQAGDPMIYKTNDDGTGYLVYSIGENRIDDDGRTYSDEPKGDDLRRERNYW